MPEGAVPGGVRTNLGVDLLVNCGEFGDCFGVDGNGTDLGFLTSYAVDFETNSVILAIPEEVIQDAIPGEGVLPVAANAAVLGGQGDPLFIINGLAPWSARVIPASTLVEIPFPDDGFGDIVPNNEDGHFQTNLGRFNEGVIDPRADTFRLGEGPAF